MISLKQYLAANDGTDGAKAMHAAKQWVIAVGFLAVTFLAYQPMWHASFIWDDDDYVTNNKALRTADGLRQIWVNPDATVQYYPLTFTVFWVEYHLWGLHASGFHLVNVLLQAANAFLFWKLLSRLRVPGAWWAAAMFALHPVHVMSVAWITELKNVLSGLCFLAALLAYLRFCGLEDGSTVPQTNRKLFYALAVGLYFFALLSKTSTSIFPVAILLILWWKKGRIGRKELVPVLPLFLVGILFGVFTLWLEKYKKGAYGQEFALPFLDRVLVAGHSFWFGLSKLVWPTRLTFIYPRWNIDVAAAGQYLFPLGAIALLAASWWARRWLGRAPFAALVYYAVAFPALVLIQVLYMMRYAFVSDHWQYLASMSIIPLYVGGVVTALDRFEVGFPQMRVTLGAVVLAVLGLLTWRQVHAYQNLETLWRDTLAKNPQCWIADHNLANLLAQRGDMQDAIVHWEHALESNPQLPEVYNNLGTALFKTGRIQDAINQWEQAVRVDPGYFGAHFNLGVALVQIGRVGEGIEHLEEALRIDPNSFEAHLSVSAAFARLGKWRGSIQHLEKALQIKPDSVVAESRLAALLATLPQAEGGDAPRAIVLAQQACKLTDNQAAAPLDTLAVAYAAAGRFDDAVLTAQKAVQLARAASQPRLAREIEERLKLYRSGSAFHPSTAAISPGNP
ncbi:MAG TPA: tetratricopeptide repeat protein [Verrucomicrobiae bacterium]|nr:tetratricopeptide repeat protein [Verrucomicrobiae bacterium]